MPAKITQDYLQSKVFNNSLQTCDYVSGYENSQSIITIKCKKHNYEFQTKWENVRRDNRAHHLCPFCQQEDRDLTYNEDRSEVECAYCHKVFIKPNSKLNKSKSGLYFCCREHKDLAQSLISGEEFSSMRPEHYNKKDSQNYRKTAFLNYPHECAVCNYNEDENILQVHHIDENRENNSIDNLIILCPNCHAKLTYGKYILVDRKMIVKKE